MEERIFADYEIRAQGLSKNVSNIIYLCHNTEIEGEGIPSLFWENHTAVLIGKNTVGTIQCTEVHVVHYHVLIY